MLRLRARGPQSDGFLDLISFDHITCPNFQKFNNPSCFYYSTAWLAPRKHSRLTMQQCNHRRRLHNLMG